MKKIIPFIPLCIFPYLILLTFYLLLSNTLGSGIFILIAAVLLFWVLVFISSVIMTVLNLRKGISAAQACKISMFVKLIHIPGYIAVFILGVLFFVSIFTYAFSFILAIIDASLIFCTGLLGCASVIRSYLEGVLTKKQAMIYGILQFVYCFDVLFAVILYIKTYKHTKKRT